MNKKMGFTLAEVLITLGIIGILAEITIPTIINNFVIQSTQVALRNFYSVFSAAYSMAIQENGTPDTWGLTGTNPDDNEQVVNVMAKYLKVIKNCGRNPGCFPDVNYKYPSGAPRANWDATTTPHAKAQLANGNLLLITGSNPTCSGSGGATPALQGVCAYVFVDINGYKNPNQEGVDWFVFYMTKNGIIPFGTKDDTLYSFSNYCRDKTTGAGFSCAAWVLYQGNMDYRKDGCTNLSWDGPITCP